VRCGVSQIRKQCCGTEHRNKANKPASGDLHPKNSVGVSDARVFVYWLLDAIKPQGVTLGVIRERTKYAHARFVRRPRLANERH
jgi:hypothetical protein